MTAVGMPGGAAHICSVSGWVVFTVCRVEFTAVEAWGHGGCQVVPYEFEPWALFCVPLKIQYPSEGCIEHNTPFLMLPTFAHPSYTVTTLPPCFE